MIHTPPSATATAGQAFLTQPVIYEEDQFGNVEDDNITALAVSLTSGTGALHGSTSVTLKNGVATFDDLAYDIAESISLRFTAGGLSVNATAKTVVSPAAPSKLVIQTQPSATATAGQPFGTQPVVYEEDQFGNVELGDNSTVVTASLASGPGPLQGITTATVSGGVARFTNLIGGTAGAIALKFTGGSVTSQPTSADPGGTDPTAKPDANGAWCNRRHDAQDQKEKGGLQWVQDPVQHPDESGHRPPRPTTTSWSQPSRAPRRSPSA